MSRSVPAAVVLALLLSSLAHAETGKAPADPEVLEQQLKQVQARIQDAHARHRKQWQALEESEPALALAEASKKAAAAHDQFLATDPAMQEMRKQRDSAGAAIGTVREACAREDKNGAANREKMAGNYEQERQVNYDVFLADQVYYRGTRDPLLREDEAILDASAGRQEAEAALRTAQSGSQSVMDAETAARRAHLAVEMLRARAMSSPDLARAEKTVLDARAAYNELYNRQDAVVEKKKAETEYNETLAKKRDSDPVLKKINGELNDLAAERNAAWKELEDLRNRLHRWVYPEAEKDPRLGAAKRATQEARNGMYALSPEGRDSQYERLALEKARLDWSVQQKKDAPDEETGRVYNALRQAQAAYDARVAELSGRAAYRKAKETYDKAVAGETKIREDLRAALPATRELHRKIDSLNEKIKKIDWDTQMLRWQHDGWERPRVDRDEELAGVRDRMYQAQRMAGGVEREVPQLRKAREVLADAEKNLNEVREAIESSPELVKAKEALESARKAQADRVAALPESRAATEARENEARVRKAREESSSGFKTHQAMRQKADARRKKIFDARNELNKEWGEILARVEKEHPDVLAARQRYDELARSYNEATAQGRAAELGKARQEAWQTFRNKVNELAKEDADIVATGKEIRDLQAEERELRHAIAQAGKDSH